MAYSPLIDAAHPPTGRYRGQRKWSSRPRGVRINGLNVHHWAGTSMSGFRRLVESNDPASANYLIFNDGRLIGSVPETYRAWTTSSYAADDDKITVEIQNESGAPSWRISDAAMATLIRLYRDIGKRHGFTPTRSRLRGHQEYGVATACPGPYLLPRLDYVAREAQDGAQQVSNPVKTKPSGKRRRPRRMRTIRRGSRGWQVRVWQEILRASGHRIAADSIDGPITTAATRRWQGERGLVPDGIVGPRSWARSLQADSDGVLQQGDRGPHVAVLQHITRARRDQIFGSGTAEATRRVQRYLSVTPDARVGGATVSALVNHWT